jgi:hypothetical protein
MYKKVIFDSIEKKITVNEFVNLLKTGDIIFGRSESQFGRIIQFSGHCIWNHIAICVEGDDKEKYWCESTNNTNASPFKGVKIWNIKDYFNNEFTKNPNTCFDLGISKLETKNAQVLENIKKFLYLQKGKPYTKSFSVLFFAWFDGFQTINRYLCWNNSYRAQVDDEEVDQPSWALNKNDNTSYFCSQLLADCFLSVGMMKRKYTSYGVEIQPTEWSVADFANVEYLNKNLNNNFKYTKIDFYCLYRGQEK